MRSNLIEAINNLQKELDSLTLKELISNHETQERLRELVRMVNQFIEIMNPRKMPFSLKIVRRKYNE
jgi:hypothetical protein